MSPFQSCLDYLEQLEDALHGPLQLIEPHAVDELGFGLDFSADDLCTWHSFFPQVTACVPVFVSSCAAEAFFSACSSQMHNLC